MSAKSQRYKRRAAAEKVRADTLASTHRETREQLIAILNGYEMIDVTLDLGHMTIESSNVIIKSININKLHRIGLEFKKI